MYIKFTFIFAFFFCYMNYGYSQNCDCNSTLKWLKETFEENDAGFKYILSLKGQAAYDYHNNIIAKKINAAKTKEDCLLVLQEWVLFFRKGHVYVQAIETKNTRGGSVETKPVDTSAIKKQFKDWPRQQINLSEFEKYLSTKSKHDFEGIWESPPYKIAIKKTVDGYKGILINDISPYWEAGQIKLEIKKEEEKLTGIGYLRDHTKTDNDEVQSFGNNYLQAGGFWLKRLSPSLPMEDEVQDYLTAMNSRVPYIKQLDSNTLYFRIPSFDLSHKKIIDSIIHVNDKLLSKTPNLILDIRGNGGGSDFSYSSIIPYLQTNPISVVGVDYLSTSLNNQRMLDFITKPEYKALFTEEQKKWAKKAYDSLQKHLGEFVPIEEPADNNETETLITRSPYPKQVGILIDGGVGSTSEEFVLAAKQSKKVKLFGTPTFGSLDISNMYSVKSPCNDYILGYGLSRSKRIPQYIIDGRGLQPDYFISKKMPGYKWVGYVKNILTQ